MTTEVRAPLGIANLQVDLLMVTPGLVAAELKCPETDAPLLHLGVATDDGSLGQFDQPGLLLRMLRLQVPRSLTTTIMRECPACNRLRTLEYGQHGDTKPWSAGDWTCRHADAPDTTLGTRYEDGRISLPCWTRTSEDDHEMVHVHSLSVPDTVSFVIDEAVAHLLKSQVAA